MEQAIVSCVVNRLEELLVGEAKLLAGVSQQVKEMQHQLRLMHSYLEDAYAGASSEKRLWEWMVQVKNTAYEVEDVIEIYILEVASRRRRGHGVIKINLRRLTSILDETIQLHKIGSKIEKIKTKISNLTTNLQTFGIKPIRGESSACKNDREQWLRQTYSHDLEEDIVGLEDIMEELASPLVSSKEIPVICIWGMGGLGKTTLAKMVYKGAHIRNHFECLAWVYVSQQCQTKEVWKEILLNLVPPSSREQREEINKMGYAELAEKLYQVQEEKTCLVVLDDIWTKEAWDSLKPAFPKGKAVGSKLLLTTRNREVGLYVDRRSCLCEPKYLDEEESWELLKKKAFRAKYGMDCMVDKKMEKLGKEMVQHCAGLPLAIVVLGGILATKNTFNGWETVHRNIKSYLTSQSNGGQESRISDILALSYKDLPYNLKACFLHLGQFPENFEIPRKKIVQMWVAEGLVAPEQCGGKVQENSEDVAERFLGELVERCMVQVGERSSCGRIKTCRIHELMRDMCLLKAKEENFLQTIFLGHENAVLASSSLPPSMTNAFLSSNTRRVLFHSDQNYFGNIFSEGIKAPYLRSLILFNAGFDVMRNWQSMVIQCKLLRVLDLEGFRFGQEKLPKEIGGLIHLKYLSLKNTDLKELPSSIGNLFCLQTLDMRTSAETYVPNMISKINGLRHLHLPWNISRRCIQLQLDSLINLETLDNFQNGKCNIQDLTSMARLQILKMPLQSTESSDWDTQLNAFKELDILLKHQTFSLVYVRSLSLQFKHGSRGTYSDIKRLIKSCSHLNKLRLSCLQFSKLPEEKYFPPNITKLILERSELEEDPFPILEKLPNIRILQLLWCSYKGRHMMCSNDGFPKLASLYLQGLLDLEEWKVEEGAMHCLSQLLIHSCGKLKKVPKGLATITTLRELEMKYMSYTFLKRLGHDQGEDFHIVKHIPHLNYYRV
ncbi:NB-ARC [Dillenia turbinata]|uniref:NB-ARC n=1 Tax=Dillenia turbinata TaxID=194707 RepID=A0AAN8YWX4_9MAGN